MEEVKFKDGNICKASYEAGELIIKFASGKDYRYFDVPSPVWERFKNSPSPNNAYFAEINGKFRHEIMGNVIEGKEERSIHINKNVKKFERLGGTGIKISPKSTVSKCYPGLKITIPGESIVLEIEIGSGHDAYVVMGIEAWEAIKRREAIRLDTINDHKRL